VRSRQAAVTGPGTGNIVVASRTAVAVNTPAAVGERGWQALDVGRDNGYAVRHRGHATCDQASWRVRLGWGRKVTVCQLFEALTAKCFRRDPFARPVQNYGNSTVSLGSRYVDGAAGSRLSAPDCGSSAVARSHCASAAQHREGDIYRASSYCTGDAEEVLSACYETRGGIGSGRQRIQ